MTTHVSAGGNGSAPPPFTSGAKGSSVARLEDDVLHLISCCVGARGDHVVLGDFDTGNA